MSVVNILSGAVGPDGATVKTKVTGTTCRLAVADNPSLSAPRYFGPVIPTAEGIATFVVTGLAADTQHWCAVEDDSTLDTTKVGRFHTHGPVGEPYSFTFGHATCAGRLTSYPVAGALIGQASDHPVFDDIRGQDPMFFVHGGDLHYYDIGQTSGGDPDHVADYSPSSYRRAYDDVLAGRQGTLFRNVPLVYAWDDHDFGPNDSNNTSPGNVNAAQVYRERIPSYALPAADGQGIYHTFQVGRVLYVVSDGRYYRDPVSHARPRAQLGATQIAWMESVLSASTAKVLCWVQGQDWTHNIDGESSWGSYAEERAQIVEMLGDTGWLNRMFMLVGDSHAMCIDSGSGRNADFGAFPIYMFSPLDSAPTPGPIYDIGRRGSTSGGGRGQWGLVQVQDNGSSVRITGTGYWWSP